LKIWRQRGRGGSGSAEHLRSLLDEREIRRCILRYCHGTDRLDWQLVVDCYVPGASDDHGSFNGPVDKLADWLADKSRHRGAKQHYIANQLIEIVGDAAVCESYYFCYIEFTGDPEFGGRQDPTAVIMGGRYVDRLIRYQDEWRIDSRTVLIDWSRNLGRPVPWSAPAAAAFTAGRQDGQDVAQLALAEMARLRSSHRRDLRKRA
jgi:hypothetical protein